MSEVYNEVKLIKNLLIPDSCDDDDLTFFFKSKIILKKLHQEKFSVYGNSVENFWGGNFMKETNLFSYATSELSQDAFICWLMSHAKIANQNKNPEITKCALDFLHAIPKLNNAKNISEIQRQYSVGKVRIDVLLIVDDYKVIIEDKISAVATDLQIQEQKNALIDEGVQSDKIICVFYKTAEQCYKPAVDKNFFTFGVADNFQ